VPIISHRRFLSSEKADDRMSSEEINRVDANAPSIEGGLFVANVTSRTLC